MKLAARSPAPLDLICLTIKYVDMEVREENIGPIITQTSFTGNTGYTR